MDQPLRATIVFYDEDLGQLRACTVFRREVQAVIDRELASSGGMILPPDAAGHSHSPVTDEDARKLGAFAILMQAGAHPELRERLQITTASPIDWTPALPPGAELERFNHFHDWHLDTLAIQGETDPKVPDTVILELFDQRRRVRIAFRGVTRVGIENGGILNIVNAIETVSPGSESYERAQALLVQSAHDQRRAGHVAYVFSTVGAEIAVEFDSLRVETV